MVKRSRRGGVRRPTKWKCVDHGSCVVCWEHINTRAVMMRGVNNHEVAVCDHRLCSACCRKIDPKRCPICRRKFYFARMLNRLGFKYRDVRYRNTALQAAMATAAAVPGILFDPRMPHAVQRDLYDSYVRAIRSDLFFWDDSAVRRRRRARLAHMLRRLQTSESYRNVLYR